MKRIYLSLIAMLLSFMGFAQPFAATGLVVENRSNCTQYYILFGDKPCVCGSAFNSQVFTIPPGVTQVHPNTLALGGSYPTGTLTGIVGARVFNGPPGCGTPFGIVGQSFCGHPPSYAYTAISASCSPCSSSTAIWTSATSCSGRALLRFTP